MKKHSFCLGHRQKTDTVRYEYFNEKRCSESFPPQTTLSSCPERCRCALASIAVKFSQRGTAGQDLRWRIMIDHIF